MRELSAARYAESARWPELLRSHALRPPNRVVPRDCLDAFAQHDDYYAARLAGITDWDAVPELTKSELAAVPVASAEPLYAMRTSGTSGRQLIVQSSASDGRFRQALSYRPLLFCGLPAVVRQVIFRDGDEVEAAERQQFPFRYGGSVYLTWRVGIAAPPARIYALLRAVRPQVVRGLTSGIVRFVQQRPGPLDGLGVRWVSTSGEYLVPAWRAELEQGFAARVLDRYGSTETGSIAWQCPLCGRYHANTDEQLLELQSDGLVVTPLFIAAQPLLRYRLDDVLEWHASPSHCPIALPTVRITAARRDDWLLDGAGARVSPLSLQLERVPGLQRWRLHQDAAGELTLYVDGELAAAAQAELVQQVRALVPGRPVNLAAGTDAAPVGVKFKRVTSALTGSQA